MRLISLTFASLIVVAAVSPSDAASRLRMNKQQSYASQQQQTMGPGAELGMVQIQSLVSQRQMALQAPANMMDQLDKSARAVAANMGGSCNPNC